METRRGEKGGRGELEKGGEEKGEEAMRRMGDEARGDQESELGLLSSLVGDGRPLLTLVGLSLVGVGGFALFLAATGHFLPQDVAYLGMTADDLCRLHGCRVVHFMEHDRVAFGGSLIAVGTMYLWLIEFPLRRGEAWAWWLFVLSGITGFGSFLAYLGYGYLDTWHGVATLFLLPIFVAGLVITRRRLKEPRGLASIFTPGSRRPFTTLPGLARLLFLFVAAGMFAAGLTIMIVGMTSVFVPQDLQFMQVSPSELRSINPRLIPLIAHDRAGFGGGICTCGLTVLFSVWCGRLSKSLWQALCLAGIAGFAAAIGVHPAVGYTDLTHLGPAIAGAAAFVMALVLSWPAMRAPSQAATVGATDLGMD